jgi:hypothetical protein
MRGGIEKVCTHRNPTPVAFDVRRIRSAMLRDLPFRGGREFRILGCGLENTAHIPKFGDLPGGVSSNRRIIAQIFYRVL